MRFFAVYMLFSNRNRAMELPDTTETIANIVKKQRHNPVFVFRPVALKRALTYFKANFKAELLYAVKTNPEPHVITRICQQGIKAFDAASLQEINLIRKISQEAEIYFMHPVKSRHAIKEAYFKHGVRHFSLDTTDELHKILDETQHANDLTLHIRIAIPNNYAEHNLAEKFGIDLQQAPALLKLVQTYAHKTGICFHAGSQCMHPDAYRIAIRMIGEIIEHADVPIEFFNVGGGFPSIYPGMTPPPLSEYFSAIHDEFEKINVEQKMKLLAEPGRALVAETTSLIVRVDLRKEDVLYINDGTYGSLFDAGVPNFIYPMQLISPNQTDSTNLLPYSFYGPTCDTLDYMKGPFYLPKNIKEGDYIEIGQMGAYGRTLATGFNGFSHEKETFFVSDEPLMTMYNQAHVSSSPLEIIAA